VKINRRTLLRGVLGGAAITVGLPPLEAFFDTHGKAYAADGTVPRRFGIFYWGNGMHPERWTPANEGAGWTPSEQLMPLAALASEITVVTGMMVKTGNSVPHGSGPAGLLTGAPVLNRGTGDFSFNAPTLDQIIANEIGKETRFKSLELGMRPGPGLSFNGQDNRNPPESSPHRLFDRIFGGGFTLPGTDPIIDPKVRLRRSVLDAVMNDSAKLRERLGVRDQRRLDQHLEGVRELERRLARLEERPLTLEACRVPAEPMADYPDIEGRPQMSAINRAHADIMALALACDQTRVFSNFFTFPVNNVLFPMASAGHHQLTHDEPGDQPQVNAIVKQIMTELAYFLGALQAVEEGDGTILDHSVVLCTSDVSFPRTHSIEEYPILLAGSAAGALKKGIHYRSPSSENTSKVSLSLLRAMGLRAAEFGVGGGLTTESLGAIEA